ncbi:hypothetical protein CFP56_011248 [Quercus suber]|uniref:Transmembrane protein n=1 Tax=Quercus suber TaxID=58331 RepID=A0AAW0MCK5_QUESU
MALANENQYNFTTTQLLLITASLLIIPSNKCCHSTVNITKKENDKGICIAFQICQYQLQVLIGNSCNGISQ